MNLAFIKNLIERYNDITIGWSTHENKGSIANDYCLFLWPRMFEKHIGISTKKYKLNNYSIQSDDFEKYLTEFLKVKETWLI